MVKKTAVPAAQGSFVVIRGAVAAYGIAEKKCFKAWGDFFGTMNETTRGVAYKMLLEDIRTVDGEVLPKAKCSATTLLEYHKVATSKSRYAASIRAKASSKAAPSTWVSLLNADATRRIAMLQKMKPEKTLGRSVTRLVAALQVVVDLTK